MIHTNDLDAVKAIIRDILQAKDEVGSCFYHSWYVVERDHACFVLGEALLAVWVHQRRYAGEAQHFLGEAGLLLGQRQFVVASVVRASGTRLRSWIDGSVRA